jgi:predicted nucleic acid-binding protein
VSKWFNNQDETNIHICALTVFEIAKNAARRAKKEGNTAQTRKIEAWLVQLKTDFGSRILSLNAIAAEDWGRMIGTRDKHLIDTGIAAIAKENKFHVVTRNAKDFVARGATVTNPFHDPVKVIAATT